MSTKVTFRLQQNRRGRKRRAEMKLLTLTFDLLLRSFNVAQHPWHVDAVPVHVLEEDVCIPPGQRACLQQNTLVSEAAQRDLLLVFVSKRFFSLFLQLRYKESQTSIFILSKINILKTSITFEKMYRNKDLIFNILVLFRF